MRKILWIMRDDGGCGFFRCQQPAEFIRRHGFAETEVVLQRATPAQLMSADLVIMQEMGSVNASDIARFCIEHHIPYMTEFDDFVHHVSPRNVGGYGAWNPGTLYVNRAMEITRAAFAVQVSTPRLAREYFPYNPTIFVVPNYLDKELWDNPVPKRDDGKVRIGWFGGNAHADDLHMISLAVEKLVKESKGKVIFETMGMTAQELQGVFPLRKADSSCPSCGDEGQLHHYPGESLKNYPMVLASRGWDVAVAPVIDNSFGNCKSDLKVKEYAAAGFPAVVSPVAPYRAAAKEGASLLFADSFSEWYDQLKELAYKPKKREKMVTQNKDWISKNWIQDRAKSIFEIYDQVMVKADAVLGKKADRH